MFEEIVSYINQSESHKLLFLSLILIIIYFVAKMLMVRSIQNSDSTSIVEQTQSIKRVKSYGLFILLLAIFSLWFSQLQTVFISLLAFAAAFVLAFKEVIMCITGGMLIRVNKYFSVSDRIEVDGVRGFVVDRSLTSTKVLELGPEKNSQQTTGNIISIPNSVFLAKSAVNQSYFQNYSIASFSFSPADKFDYRKSEEVLLKIGNKIAAEYLSKAEKSISEFCRKEGLSIPLIEPRVKLILSENNEAKLLLKMPVDNKNIAFIEQVIFRDYYDHIVTAEKSLSSPDPV